MFFSRDRLETEFLPHALEIEETPASPLGRALIWLIALITASAFAWSYFGKVDTVASARGKIIPDGEIKVIQPMREGVVKAIHAKEGDHVKKGQLLIELDPTIREADLESHGKMLSIHRGDKKRLLAELSGQEMAGPVPTGSQPAGAKVLAEILRLQHTLKGAVESEYKAREEALSLVVSQRRGELSEAQTQLAKFEKVVPILREQEETSRQLHQKGVLPRNDLLNKQKELYESEHAMGAQKMVVRQKEDGLAEALKNLDALQREREKAILTSLIETEKSIASVEGELKKAKKEHEFDRIAAPVDGYVHELAAHTVGGVVKPAQPVVTIVPEDTPLIIEAQALNTDIGFLATGQDVEAKIDTFPFQKYGTLHGKVTSISPDAVEDEKLGHVYKIKANLDDYTLVVDGSVVHLSPGMTVSLEIKTGTRRIIEFFLSPIVKYAHESLTVR